MSPQHIQETVSKQRLTGSSFLETESGDVNDHKSSYKTTMEGNIFEIKPPLSLETENNLKISHDLSNLDKAITKLENISKKISVSSLGDSYDRFGRYIVSLLRRFSPKKIKLFKRKLIKFISNHLVGTSKKLHVCDSKRSQKMSLIKCKKSQESKEKHSIIDLKTYQNEINTSQNHLNALKDKSTSDPCDSYQVSTLSSSEKPASSSHISCKNHTYMDENVTQTTLPKINLTKNNQR